MERLTVKNFGPITSADIDVRKFTLLVGHVSSGKSTIAKLLSIFHSTNFYSIASDSTEPFIKLLEDYNIDFPIKSDTEIIYNNGDYEWKVDSNGFFSSFVYGEVVSKLLSSVSNIRESILELSKSYSDLYDILGDEIRARVESEDLAIMGNVTDLWVQSYFKARDYFKLKMDSLYIPAERNIFAILDGNVFNLFSRNLPIPKSLLDFGSSYESAKQQAEKQSKQKENRIDMPFLQNTSIDFGNEAEEGTSKLYVSVDEGCRSPMRQVSSGLQSLVPLFLCIEFWGKWQNGLLIEEPESNLFPTVQNELIKYIVATTNRPWHSMNCIITSHSPYILSSFDALLQAGNASEKNPKETAKIVPPELWIKYDDISCYYFDEKGNVANAKNDELKNIGSEVIDTVSDSINEEYDKLLNIIYG
jgi:predicted ATP-dependent endonuclease of OLD family